VPGTIYDIYNPVSNIVAAANYAADRYGSIDNVWGAY
jgi:SLT domain-containing protein